MQVLQLTVTSLSGDDVLRITHSWCCPKKFKEANRSSYACDILPCSLVRCVLCSVSGSKAHTHLHHRQIYDVIVERVSMTPKIQL